MELGCNFRALGVWSFSNAEITTDINSEVLDSLLAKLLTFLVTFSFFLTAQKEIDPFFLSIFSQHYSHRIPGNDSLDL